MYVLDIRILPPLVNDVEVDDDGDDVDEVMVENNVFTIHQQEKKIRT